MTSKVTDPVSSAAVLLTSTQDFLNNLAPYLIESKDSVESKLLELNQYSEVCALGRVCGPGPQYSLFKGLTVRKGDVTKLMEQVGHLREKLTTFERHIPLSEPNFNEDMKKLVSDAKRDFEALTSDAEP